MTGGTDSGPSAGGTRPRPTPAFAVEGLGKTYGPVRALHDVTLAFPRGEVHALLGQNGSGKSTLVKILSGTVEPTTGTVRRDGEPIRFGSVGAAGRAGVVTVFQELSVLPALTVAENVMIGRFGYTAVGTVKRRELHHRAQSVLDRHRIDLPVDMPCRMLSLLQLQLVEIARSLASEASLLILDEATSSLDKPDAENLLRIAREIAEDGRAVLFVSHRMDEVFAVADRVSVLTDGELVHDGPIGEASHEQLLARLAGKALRPLEGASRGTHVRPDDVRMRATIPGFGAGGGELHLAVRAGEVVGLAGLQGHGQKEVLRRLAGDVGDRHLRIEVGGSHVSRPSPHRLVRAGVAYVPEDRHAEGLLLGHSVRTNSTLSALSKVTRGGFLRRSREEDVCRKVVDGLTVRTPSQTVPVDSLSGGNQQKVLIGRALQSDPDVLLLDDPTRGVDAGAKADIYLTLQELTAGGRSVVLNSTELPELAALCDRVLVFHDRELAAELEGADVDEGRILAYMVGAGS